MFESLARSVDREMTEPSNSHENKEPYMVKKTTAKKLRIKSVTFRANVQLGLGKFQHIHAEATADVPTGEDPKDVMDALKEFVGSELRRAQSDAEPKLAPPVKQEARVLRSGWLR